MLDHTLSELHQNVAKISQKNYLKLCESFVQIFKYFTINQNNIEWELIRKAIHSTLKFVVKLIPKLNNTSIEFEKCLNLLKTLILHEIDRKRIDNTSAIMEFLRIIECFEDKFLNEDFSK